MARLATILAIIGWLTFSTGAGLAQQPSPDLGEAPCQAGELCEREDAEEPSVSRQPVNDPPGRYLRSLVTIGFIAALVGTYLFVALTGHLPIRRRAVGRR